MNTLEIELYGAQERTGDFVFLFPSCFRESQESDLQNPKNAHREKNPTWNYSHWNNAHEELYVSPKLLICLSSFSHSLFVTFYHEMVTLQAILPQAFAAK